MINRFLNEKIADHIENHCGKAQIACIFKEIGCPEKIERDSMNNHIKCGVESHLQLLFLSHVKLADSVRFLQNEKATMQEQIEKLQLEKETLQRSMEKIGNFLCFSLDLPPYIDAFEIKNNQITKVKESYQESIILLKDPVSKKSEFTIKIIKATDHFGFGVGIKSILKKNLFRWL